LPYIRLSLDKTCIIISGWVVCWPRPCIVTPQNGCIIVDISFSPSVGNSRIIANISCSSGLGNSYIISNITSSLDISAKTIIVNIFYSSNHGDSYVIINIFNLKFYINYKLFKSFIIFKYLKKII